MFFHDAYPQFIAALPENNSSSPLKMDGWKMNISFWKGIFLGAYKAMLILWKVDMFGFPLEFFS